MLRTVEALLNTRGRDDQIRDWSKIRDGQDTSSRRFALKIRAQEAELQKNLSQRR